MKPLKTLLIATFSLALFSCGNTQTATTRVDNTPDTKGTIREVADRDDNTWNRDSDETTSTTNTPTSASTDRTMNNSNTTTSADMNSNNKASQQSTMSSTAPRTLKDNEVEVYWISLKKVDASSMYEYTNMSKDQILKYQRGYADYIDSMQNKHMRLTIDQKDLLKQRDGILLDILKPAQYDKYKEWKKMNPNEGM